MTPTTLAPHIPTVSLQQNGGIFDAICPVFSRGIKNGYVLLRLAEPGQPLLTPSRSSALLASPSEVDAGGEHRRPGRDMRCLSAFAAILTVVAGAFFLLQGRLACPNDGALQDLPLPPPPPLPSKALLLALGVITAPGHFNRRVWMRQKLRVTEARRRGVRVLFVLGSQNHMSGKQRKAVRHEERAHQPEP